LAKIAIVQMLGSMENEWTFSFFLSWNLNWRIISMNIWIVLWICVLKLLRFEYFHIWHMFWKLEGIEAHASILLN
jgi:hypothetical protein